MSDRCPTNVKYEFHGMDPDESLNGSAFLLRPMVSYSWAADIAEIAKQLKRIADTLEGQSTMGQLKQDDAVNEVRDV